MKMIRGDTLKIRFKVINKMTNEAIQEKVDEMFFTVKANYNLSDYLFQKKLSDGTITYNEADNYYYLTIKPEDTDNLDVDTDYDYDVEIVIKGDKKTRTGKLSLYPEVTWAINEVD